VLAEEPSSMRSAWGVVWGLWLVCVGASAAEAFQGRLVDSQSGGPIAGAEVMIVGLPGSVKTDADGRFTWAPDPTPPFEVLVILPGGRVAKPIRIDKVDWASVLTIQVQPVLSEDVTVTGVAPSIDATPGAGMTLLSATQIALRAPANLTQALEGVPGVTQVSEGQAAVPAVRSLARGRTLLMIDGGRVSSERRVGPSAAFMDPFSVENVDVARGPGSVAYGSDAFGGVISVRTRRPEPETPLRGRIVGAIGAGVPDRRAGFEVTRGWTGGGVLVQGHYREAPNYRSPEGDVPNSGYRDRGILARAERMTSRGYFSAGWQSDFGRDIERPRDNSATVRFYYPYEDSHRFTASYERVNVAGLSQLRVQGFLGGYRQRTDQDRSGTATTPRSIERADIRAGDYQLRATAERPAGHAKWEFGADLNGRFGLEAHEIRIAYDLSDTVTSETDTVAIERATRRDTGLFVQMAGALHARLSAAGGVRFDHVYSGNTGGYFGNRSQTHQAVSGFGSITVGPVGDLSFTAQIARGFRDPTLSDRYFRGPTGRGFITGNPKLDPETSLQADVAVRYTVGRFRLAAYTYFYRIDDLVERYQTDADTFFFRNRGRARLRGVEIEAQADLGRGCGLDIALQSARGVALDDDAALDDVGAPSVAVTLRKSISTRARAEVRLATFVDDDRPGPTEVAQPGYTLLEAGLSWTAARRLEVLASARNLLDAKYYASPDPRWVHAPGASVSVTAVVKLER
jgi:hemoglobin/transferrin/lactoferrin receptor protein